MPTRALEGVCQLTRLSSLELLGLREAGQQGSLKALSQLTALERLGLEASCHGRVPIEVPPELSRLQALVELSIIRLACCSNGLCGLPCLTRLALHQHLSSDDDGPPLPDELRIPSNLAFLPRLRELHVHSAMLSGSLLALSSLTRLTLLDFCKCIMDPGIPASQLSSALTSITCLQDVYISGLYRRTFCEAPSGLALRGLAAMTQLSIEQVGLQSLQCSRTWCSLRSLQLEGNRLACMPDSLSCLSSLVYLNLADQAPVQFQVTHPLLPILRALPCLSYIDLRQHSHSLEMHHHWDSVSIMYLVEAAAALYKDVCQVRLFY